MKRSALTQLVIYACLTGMYLQTLQAASQAPLIDRLMKTRAVNIESIIGEQFGKADTARGFSVADPYGQNASKTVRQWNQGDMRDKEMCGIRFVDSSYTRYELHVFDSQSSAVKAGYTVTHQGRCGSCSTLQDLAVYLAVPDLVTPARQCARKTGLKRKKQCFQENIGFTPYCAESWAYNALHTRQECLGTCISDYGLFNLIFGRYHGDNVDGKGRLRPCLQCDEDRSGPGFKYSAGRTRRNSGIESAIQRSESEQFTVDHLSYFP